MRRTLPWILMVVFWMGYPAGSLLLAANPEDINAIEMIDIKEFQEPLPKHMPVVDVVIHMTRDGGVPWPLMRDQFRTAREVFKEAGVYLNLRMARWISVPADWLQLECGRKIDFPLENDLLQKDLYAFITATKDQLPQKTSDVFSAIAGQTTEAYRTVQVITLKGMGMMNPIEGKAGFVEWEEISTSAVSFPSYLYNRDFPKPLRGVISFNPSEAWYARSEASRRKTLAHELGHKLINVSHEGAGVCPQAEVDGEQSLMLYGISTVIGGGKENRWHLERLHLSPFLYQLRDGKKIWNKAYQSNGVYDDPLYGHYVMRPICPEM